MTPSPPPHSRHYAAAHATVAHVVPRIGIGGLLEHLDAGRLASNENSFAISIFAGDDAKIVSSLDLDVVALNIGLVDYLSEDKVVGLVANALKMRAATIVHSYHFFSDVYAFWAADRLQIPTVQTVAGIPQRLWSNIFAFRTKWDLTSSEIDKAKSLPPAASTLTVSRFIEQKWRSYGLWNGRTRVSYLGTDVDVNPVQPAPDGGMLEILFLHRLEPVKLSDQLLPALRIAAGRGLKMRLTVVLHGSATNCFVGELTALGIEVNSLNPKRSIWSEIPYADCLLLTSRSEGLPLTVLEAMAREVPVVATDVGGTAEAVMDGVTGVLVSDQSAESLADALMRIWLRHDDRRKMGRRARERVRENFNRSAHLKELAQVYQASAGS